MLRAVVTAGRCLRTTGLQNVIKYVTPSTQPFIIPARTFSSLWNQGKMNPLIFGFTLNLNYNPKILQIASNVTQQPIRSVTKFSLKKGKRKSVRGVIKRFKRLDWGGWIRTRSGRTKKLWKKSPPLKRRLRQHVLVNSTQAWLLDKMVTKFWRRPKYYVNDPYRPYHSREEFVNTRKKSLK